MSLSYHAILGQTQVGTRRILASVECDERGANGPDQGNDRGIQKRVEEIATEATRLIVFANTTSDPALGSRLNRIARILFRSATEIAEIEDRLKTLK